MSKRRHSPTRFAWKSACKTCNVFFQWCYSALVLLLATVTVFTAYVATLDDIPVPSFVIRELRGQLENQGIYLRTGEVRFHPNGQIIIEEPEFYSPELGSTIIAADQLIARIKLSHLVFGGITIDQVKLSAGRLILPAMLTPNGEPATALHSINIDASLRAQRWNIRFANAAIGNLKLAAHGRLDKGLLELPAPKPDAPPFSLNRLIFDIAPKISRLQKELERFESPACNINLYIKNRQQAAKVRFDANQINAHEQLLIHDASLWVDFALGAESSAKLESGAIELPKQEVTARGIRLSAGWIQPITPDSFLPERIQIAMSDIEYQEAVVPSIVTDWDLGGTTYRGSVQTQLPSRTTVAHIRHDTISKLSKVDLRAELDTDTLQAFDPLAQKLAKISLVEMASLDSGVDIHLKADLDEKFKPIQIEAVTQTGAASLMGAKIDYADSQASFTGSQIDVSEIRLRSGEQAGVIKIGYNLDTLLRRILVEGSFDPTMINDWFKPWWAAMWDGMVFPAEGMLTYLDSQATFKRPDTVFVTGIGYVRDLDLRGMPVDELRTRIFSLFHYVDLYEMELETASSGQARGEIQFHMDRDVRDEKDKLTGIWVDAISTLDVKQAPNILWEIATESAKILEPYCYDLPPLIIARSSSVRHQDAFFNDIDLEIEAESNFTFYGYPFESLDAFVHVDDDVIDIPFAQATLGGGIVDTSAFIVGDELTLEAQLTEVGFGRALNATNTYFASNSTDSSEGMDPERLLSFGGKLNANFQGAGFVGDPVSFVGEGAFDIAEADFGSFRLFGLLSAALEITPLRFTTLKFTEANSPFTVNQEKVSFSKGKIEGGGASIETEGFYNIETDAINFAARLYPFRNSRVPLITPIINLPLNIFSNVFEVSVTGTFDEPQLRLFDPSTKEAIDVAPDDDPRDHRPTRK